MPRQVTHNPKRHIRQTSLDGETRTRLGRTRVYSGSPQHKRNPGDFGLTPPSDPRPGKSLCDLAEVHSHGEAHRLLQAGFRDGLVSQQLRNGWPQNVWAVRAEDEEVFEAQLEIANLAATMAIRCSSTTHFENRSSKRGAGAGHDVSDHDGMAQSM